MKLHARLKAARLHWGLSLRAVETLSEGAISNPYLCRIENGKEFEISPHKLRVLARILKLDYIELMIHAGYLTVKDLKGRV